MACDYLGSGLFRFIMLQTVPHAMSPVIHAAVMYDTAALLLPLAFACL